jgi:hypothetical protein
MQQNKNADKFLNVNWEGDNKYCEKKFLNVNR